jgi:hypothetical protein
MVTYPVTRVPVSSGLSASLPIATYYQNFVTPSLGSHQVGGEDLDLLYRGLTNMQG